eukprot:g7771.t1
MSVQPSVWNKTFVDGEILNENIEKIEFRGKVYNVKIQVGKYKNLVDNSFAELLRLPSYKDSEEIVCSLDKDGKLSGKDAKWVRGQHPALRYRGNALRRHKVWFQQNDEGFFAYKYTGWQKKVLNATFKIDKKVFPYTTKLVNEMKKTCSQNHWIATIYEDGNDYIGMHSDKTRTWKEGSNFQVVKWGCPRIFQVALKDHEDVDKCTILFRKTLLAGTSVTVDMKTNEITRHGVPIMDDNSVGVSGSIVGREIETFISFEESKKMIEQAKKDQLKRRVLKACKNNVNRKKKRKVR